MAQTKKKRQRKRRGTQGGRIDTKGSRGGRPRSLGFLGPGEVFGEAALWGSEASLATVQTRGKVLALRMPSGTFREVVMTHPQVMEYVGELAELRRVAIESPRSVVDRKLDLL